VLISIAIVVFVIGAFSVLSFIFAITPQEAIERGMKPMPATWEAGVFNHGEYYRWYAIERHPILFMISALMVIGPSIFMAIAVLIISAILLPYLRNTVFADFIK